MQWKKKQLLIKSCLIKLNPRKVVVISSWIKYCTSCAGQMKIFRMQKIKVLLDIKFDNIEYFSFDVTKKDISNFFDVQYQTTLIIFKG